MGGDKTVISMIGAVWWCSAVSRVCRVRAEVELSRVRCLVLARQGGVQCSTGCCVYSARYDGHQRHVLYIQIFSIRIKI